MTLLRIGSAGPAFAALAAIAACSSPREAPRPAPAPAPAPAPVQRPVPRPAPVAPDAAWIDAPLAPGDWTQEGSEARYGTGSAVVFTVRCSSPGQVVLVRAGAASAAQMTIRTSSVSRSLAVRAGSGGVEAALAASDPLLDAMFYSRGRYSIEVAGMPRLVVPSWPEPARVVEDCRS